MNKGICNVSIAPLRADSSDKSEIVSQLLYGESADIIEVKDNWTKIITHYDNYEAWMDTKQISPVSDELIASRKRNLVKEPFQSTMTESGKVLLSMGSEVNFETTAPTRGRDLSESIINCAKEFLNVPYLWGGKSFFGIDCSGFTQIIYKIHGIKIPRDTYQQAELGEALTFIEEAKPGDLAFFENSEGRIIHVGFILADQKIIHAHGKVRIDSLDSTGIFNKDQNKHTHKLRFIRSYF
ncbi:C40 family peptidase [Epilithonimonas arachidiradicis]|uniref:Cell wall-associated NlpC family hydrolase n=1 Tax=Epilithonimonas arachidiradicis TaxID=1617282 RepID=A0A420CMP5_9FLAO|nr:C40 family peptidase [Epilithonimonas arachidiradicis]RKE79671.1 cell wall-associated NlpC family hydrolase [Epilithonimonas arachidiradicis]GGG52653.1 hydrolase Nlp/P60 [Epilithonimonas arachidiradicis]